MQDSSLLFSALGEQAMQIIEHGGDGEKAEENQEISIPSLGNYSVNMPLRNLPQ